MFVITDYTKTRIIWFEVPGNFTSWIIYKSFTKFEGFHKTLVHYVCIKKSATHLEQPLTLYQLFDNLRTIKLQQFINTCFLR